MKTKSCIFQMFLFYSAVCIVLIGVPVSIQAQDFPNKPITIYCGFAAGATTDIVARALANGVEKLLGVPVMVEQKVGGNATVAAGLVATKKPDGYTLSYVSSDAIMRLPFLMKVPYNPMKDFTYIGQYAYYAGALVVHADSPIKTAEEFIAYAKAHPGLTYATGGKNSHQGLPIRLLAECKGLQFTEIPYTGGAEAVTNMLGKHVDFLAGSGSHYPYVDQGKFRQLIMHHRYDRNPDYPDVPTLRELGCPDVQSNAHLLIGPIGMTDAVYNKLSTAFRKIADSAELQALLKQIRSPYCPAMTREALKKEMEDQYKYYIDYYKKAGMGST